MNEHTELTHAPTIPQSIAVWESDLELGARLCGYHTDAVSRYPPPISKPRTTIALHKHTLSHTPPPHQLAAYSLPPATRHVRLAAGVGLVRQDTVLVGAPRGALHSAAAQPAHGRQPRRYLSTRHRPTQLYLFIHVIWSLTRSVRPRQVPVYRRRRCSTRTLWRRRTPSTGRCDQTPFSRQPRPVPCPPAPLRCGTLPDHSRVAVCRVRSVSRC